ncbi:RNA-guided endonuclease TnpB family protein [Streptomyces mayteni]
MGQQTKRIKQELVGIPAPRRSSPEARGQSPRRPRVRPVKPAGARERAYRFRCYPTAAQAEQLVRTFGACRWVYNEGLALREGAWRRYRVSVSYVESCRALTGWRQAAETGWLRDVSSTVLQQSLRHLDAAYQRFFRRQGRYPRRKRKGRSRDAATYVRAGMGFRWAEDGGRPGTGALTLAKHAEPLAVRWSRGMPAGAVPVKVTVSRDRAGRFFVSLLVVEVVEPLPPTTGVVGIDLGLASLVTLDTGEKVAHPRLSRRWSGRLARLQRRWHRGQPGSANRERTRRRIARLCARMADVRLDVVDKVTTRLVHENQVLVVEELPVQNLSRRGRGRRKRALNRSIRDAAWGMFLDRLRYKAEWYGRTVVVVDRFFPSTRRCSACGVRGARQPLSVREWRCGACGTAHDRDVNASRNLRAEGLRLLGARREGAPALIRAAEG